MESFFIFTPSMPAVSVLIWIIGSMIVLALARDSMHKMIQAMSEGTAGGLRKLSEWTKITVEQMREKDRKVLLESGVANIQHKIMQEFHKIDTANTRSLADYPKLQLRLDDHITNLEKDYKDCGQASPQAPGWGDVIETIAKAQSSAGDRIIEKMLSEIHKSAVSGEKKALGEYRDVASKRHKILSGMAPIWKRMEKLGKDINKKVEQVIETNSRIDKYMDQYTKLSKADPDSIDMLSSRVTKLFIVSLFVIAAGIAGAFINFNLIALPMSELVPQGTRVAGMAVSEISALVIIVLELVLGIFLMESIGVTNTFPQIGAMTSSKRKVIFWGSLLGLFFLASVEASLAVLREQLAESNAALEQSLAGAAASAISGGDSKITVVGQATLGFVLPWILAMIAIPLEMFIEASQHAFARMYTILVTLFGHLANALAYLIEGLFNIIGHLFDIYIIVPSKIMDMVGGKSLSAN
ncbi:MAG: hypothetical protein OEZ23_10180 [Gammaproteobacteria bacterium]|nr:hypothetical protein [Gammaproteobacteria bacterium]